LKNTDFVEGLVVYAGHESKAMLNNGGPRYKRSKLERQMNVEVATSKNFIFFLGRIPGTHSVNFISFQLTNRPDKPERLFLAGRSSLV
jgi:hypothetical protein